MGLSRNGTNRAACVFFRALAWCESSQAQKNVQPQVEPVVRKFDRPHQGKDTATATDHTLLRCWHTPLTAQSPLQLISHFVPCALSSSKIIKTYHIYIIFTYCIRTASRPSHVHGMKPSGMLQPFLHNAQAGIPAPSGPERLCISFCSAFPTAQRRLALTCADKLYSSWNQLVEMRRFPSPRLCHVQRMPAGVPHVNVLCLSRKAALRDGNGSNAKWTTCLSQCTRNGKYYCIEAPETAFAIACSLLILKHLETTVGQSSLTCVPT